MSIDYCNCVMCLEAESLKKSTNDFVKLGSYHVKFEDEGPMDKPPLDEMKGTSDYHEIARQIADLITSKQKAYGDSFGKSGKIVRLLYPNGIPVDKLDDALTIVRVIDKLFRIATDRDALGESPWRDIAGYALLSVERVERSKSSK